MNGNEAGPDPSDVRAAAAATQRQTPDEIRALYEAKARAELAAADRVARGSDRVAYSGDLLPRVALVKGLPGPAEAVGGSALSGPDGVAASSALERLGFDPSQVFRMLSRPEPDLDRDARVRRLTMALEAVDPTVILALDAQAAEDVRDALGLAHLAFGRPVRHMGRDVLAIDGLEASLVDPARKRRVWSQMRSLRR